MTLLKIIAYISFFFFLLSCKDQSEKYRLPPLSLKLNSDAMDYVRYIESEDSCRKAIRLLDSATKIDTGYFLAYYNKVMFHCSLGEFKKAIIAIDNAIRIQPGAHDLYLMSGLLYRKTEDTATAHQLFLKSLSICNETLDTMHFTNSDYQMLAGNRILLLIMLNDREKANYFLRSLKKSNVDTMTYRQLLALTTENRDTIIAKIFDRQNYRR